MTMFNIIWQRIYDRSWFFHNRPRLKMWLNIRPWKKFGLWYLNQVGLLIHADIQYNLAEVMTEAECNQPKLKIRHWKNLAFGILIRLDSWFMPMFHIIWMVSNVFDHFFEQVVAGEYRIELAWLIVSLQSERKFNLKTIISLGTWDKVQLNLFRSSYFCIN